MDMNVGSLFFEQGENCLHMYIRHVDHPEDDAYKNDILYMTRAEVPEILKILRGEGTIFPYWADGSYLMQFMSRGARYMRTSSYMNHPGGEFIDRWYSFDGNWFANHLEKASEMSDGERYDVDATDITKERWRLRPVVKMVYGEGVEEAIQESINDPRVIVQKNHFGLDGLVKTLERSAGNRSDGQTIEVRIWIDPYTRTNDDRPWCFYYEVYDGDRRLWNGGLISHKSKEEGKWEYSSHT